MAPFGLIFAMVVAKMYICQDPRAQVDILSSFSVISENPNGQKYVFFGNVRPSEVDRGVVKWLWFGTRWSSCPLGLCIGSQECLLYSYGGPVVEYALSFCQMSKVD